MSSRPARSPTRFCLSVLFPSWRDFMKNASAMWIFAPQTRAVDDKVAQELMGASFKRQLQMDSGFDRCTFVSRMSPPGKS